MGAGNLRDRIVIEGLATSQDDYGAPSQDWTPFATRWAKVQSLSGRELIAAQAAQSEVSYRVEMRYMAGIEPKMRIRFDGKLFNIHTVRDPDGFKRELVLDCAAGVNAG